MAFLEGWTCLIILLLPAVCSATALSPYVGNVQRVKATSKHTYRSSHSLPDEYDFSRRDGWHTINVTDLEYKYSTRRALDTVESLTADRAAYDSLDDTRGISVHSIRSSAELSLGGTVSHLINDVWDALKGLGKSEGVTITWYTGHDLENPSCWSNVNWTPTDNSFICAVTLDGWTDRPKCFKFIELCNGTKKCVFVRVIDSCAGCAKGSKHVDLTKSAFSQLADINQGILTVQMREATEPDDWYEDLWGPKSSSS